MPGTTTGNADDGFTRPSLLGAHWHALAEEVARLELRTEEDFET